MSIIAKPLLSQLGRLIGLAAAAAIALPAQATLVQGDWDPAYGSPFTNLGWRGTATVFVPPACLVTNGLINTGGACLPSVQSALVEFYDITDSSPIPATVETLNFTFATSVDQLFINDGEVLAFGLAPLSRVLSTHPLATLPPSFDTNAFFELDLTIVTAPVGPGLVLLGTLASLPWYASDGGGSAGGTNATPAVVAFRTVPLPGTLALALAGLVAAAALRRR